MINTINLLLPAFFAGLALGAIHIGGLWFSIHHLLVREHAAAWFLLSFTTRNLIVLFGFYWIMDGQVERLLIALLGFALIRVIVSRRVAGKPRLST
jgi:F1F0 ATPase subunit 2